MSPYGFATRPKPWATSVSACSSEGSGFMVAALASPICNSRSSARAIMTLYPRDETMDYRQLGRSGLRVSPVCLGTMMFGDRTDESTARDIVAHAFGAGVNFIDTADVYTAGASERITGDCIRAE